jgi:hypothetical protein
LQLSDKAVDNKISDEVQNNKTDESNDELLQIFLIDDNKDNESNDIIVDNDSVEGMEWSLVVDESDGQLESNSRPIILQLTEELGDKNNESSVNLETAEDQQKDNNSIDESINQTKTVTTLLQKDDSIAVEVEESVEIVPKESVETVTKESIETVPKESIETVPKESVETVPKESVETVPEESIETVPKESVETVPEESIEIVSNDSSVNIEVEDAQQSVPELIKYVSMPTFCFDDNRNEPKSKSTEVEDNRSDEQMIEKSLDNDSNNDKQTDEEMIREEVVQQVEEDLSSEEIVVDILSEDSSPKETVNEEKDSEEITITDNQNTDNPKIVLNEELINSRVQHPVVSSSVEDFLPNSPLSSSSSSSNSGKIVAQKTLGVDKNSALFLPNSPLSGSDSSREVIAPTTTIVISPNDDNSLNNCLNNDQINDNNIDKNMSDIQVPISRANDQSIDKVFNANVSLSH